MAMVKQSGSYFLLLRNLADDYEIKTLRKRNYTKIKELIRISFSLGVNLRCPSLFKDSLKIICTALQTCVSIIKMIYFLFVQRNLYVLLDKAQSHEIIRQSEIFRNDSPVSRRLMKIIRDIMENNWKNIRAQLLFYICSCAVIISNYFFSALFLNMYHQIKGTPNYEHVLPYPSVYPVWESKGAVSFDGVFIVLCVHGVGLIEVLNVMIEQSTSSDVPKERRVEYLRNCINLYQNTYEYLLNISKMYKHIILSQFLLSLVIWGIVLFQMNIGLESNKITLVRMVLYLSAAGYEIIIYCYNSQRLTNEYEKIPMAFYNCDWYNESKEFKQLIRMMILRTNRIFNIKISWFTTMSLPTLMIMIKTSGSYFLLLKNLSE
ncbi:Odorant receptor 63a [Lucilia cuprina]|nr:Odorant receptor 63a [Lucilia cuprina]